MRRRVVLGGVAAVVVVAGAAGSMAGCGLFGRSLDPQVQDVVDEVEARTHASDPGDAAAFVSREIDVLLSDDVAGAVDGDALAELFETALADDDEQAELFGRVVEGVAAEGEIHSEALRPVLAEAAITQLVWIDEQVHASFDGVAPAQVRRDYFALKDLLREVMRDPGAAERLDRAVDDYAQAEIARAPESGLPRVARLRQIGRLDALTDVAWHAADLAQANGDGAIEAANAANRRRSGEGRMNSEVWVALDRYESDAEVRASAQGQPFVDEAGAIKSDLRSDEVEALRHWAGSLSVDGGLIWEDVGDIVTGAADVMVR